MFKPLEINQVKEIVRIQMKGVTELLEGYNIRLKITEESN